MLGRARERLGIGSLLDLKPFEPFDLAAHPVDHNGRLATLLERFDFFCGELLPVNVVSRTLSLSTSVDCRLLGGAKPVFKPGIAGCHAVFQFEPSSLSLK